MKKCLLFILIPILTYGNPMPLPERVGDITREMIEDRGNGGDECERVMLQTREGLKKWLSGDGPKSLNYRSDKEQKVYLKKMTMSLDNSVLSCTSEKILVNGVEKTCRQDIILGVSYIRCNRRIFLNEGMMGDNSRKRLIHHEFAAAAGLEINNGKPESDYYYSNQLTKKMFHQMEHNKVLHTESFKVVDGKYFGTRQNFCGFHLELDGDTVYMEFVDNHLSGLRCGDRGILHQGECKGKWCIIYYKKSNRNIDYAFRLKVLPDGNIIREDFSYSRRSSKWQLNAKSKFHQYR